MSTDRSEGPKSVYAAAGDHSSTPSIPPGLRLFIPCLPKLPLLFLIASYVGRVKGRALFPCWRCLISEEGYFSASFIYHSGELNCIGPAGASQVTLASSMVCQRHQTPAYRHCLALKRLNPVSVTVEDLQS